MTTLALYTGLLAVVVVERIAELVLTRRNAAWSFARGGVESGRAHYGIMVAVHALFLASCLAEPWLLGREATPAIALPALALVLLAQALRWWAILSLGPRWSTRVIVIPSAGLVRRGPYRWLRHPNYVAVVIEGVALPLVHAAWITAAWFAVANALLLATRIRCENQALASAEWRPT